MSETIKTETIPMELDRAFQCAVTLAWEDLMKPAEPRSVRVEYLCEPGSALDHLTVWSVRAGGYQDLVCDYWTWTSSIHPSGARFGNRHQSDRLSQTLDFVMKHQGRFTRPADACRDGLVRVFPPSGDDRTEAATWMRVVQALESDAGPGEASRSATDRRRDEEAKSRMDNEGDPNGRMMAVPDATGHAG